MAHSKNEDEKERSGQQVPVTYAEKAMSSLLRLHDDLVEEKEKRIDLYRRLMDREQQLAELRSYVQLLEGELSRQGALPPGASGSAGERRAIGGDRTLGLEAPRSQGALVASSEGGQASASIASKEAGASTHFAPAAAAPTEPREPAQTVAGGSPTGPSPILAWIPANAKRGGSR